MEMRVKIDRKGEDNAQHGENDKEVERVMKIDELMVKNKRRRKE